MKTFIILLTLVLLGLTASSNSQTVFTANDLNISMNNGEAFDISLESNKSTGYGWSAIVADPTIIGTEGNDYVTPETHVMGKGGNEVWHFRGVLQGETTITFNYARSWEKDTPPAKTLTFTVSIK